MAISIFLLLIGVLLLITGHFRKSDSNHRLIYIPVKVRIPHDTGSGLIWYLLFILLSVLLVAALNGA